MPTNAPCRRIAQPQHRVGQVAGALMLLVALALPVSAGEWRLGGELGHYLFYGTGEDGLLQNEVRYELSIEGRPGWDGQVLMRWKGTAALGPVEESVLFDRPLSEAWPRLDEAYVDFYFPSLDLRLGRQVVAWGTADAINPTDVVNPRSLSLDALLDREMRRLPVPAVRAALYPRPDFGLAAVGVVDFVAAPFPEDAVRQTVQQALQRYSMQLDTNWLSLKDLEAGKRYELALRAEMMRLGYDVYLSYFNGVEDLPVLWVGPGESGPPTMRVYGQYRRQQQYGLAVAGTLADAGVWAEVAYIVPEAVDVLDGKQTAVMPLSSNDPSWQGVVGVDYRPVGDLYLSGQLVGLQGRTLLSPYRDPTSGTRDGLYAVGLLRYSRPLSHTTWEVTALTNLRDKSSLVSPGLTYELGPELELTVRYLGVLGDETTEFGHLRSQMQGVATRLVWSF